MQVDPAPRPIEDYGMIGDTRTAALVSSDGSIDWLCMPRFDSAPVFGQLVGGREAGTFKAGPAGPARVIRRRYLPGTATLVTTWEVGCGRLSLTAGMVAEVAGRLLPATLLVRRLSAEGCAVETTIDFDPRRGEHHDAPRVRRRTGADLVCEWGALALSFTCDPHFDIGPGRPATFAVRPGHPVTLVLSGAHRDPLIHVNPTTAWDLLNEDGERWQAWTDEMSSFAESTRETAPERDVCVARAIDRSVSAAPVMRSADWARASMTPPTSSWKPRACASDRSRRCPSRPARDWASSRSCAASTDDRTRSI